MTETPTPVDSTPQPEPLESKTLQTKSLGAKGLVVLERAEDLLLAAILCSLIGLAFLQILLRNLFDTGIVWIGPALRYGVLWIGLLGALAATRRQEHIAIDALGRLLTGRWRALTTALSSAFSMAICALIAYHAARMVGFDREAGSIAFADVPTWTLECVIPFAFAGMALRFARRFGESLLALVRAPWQAERGPIGNGTTDSAGR